MTDFSDLITTRTADDARAFLRDIVITSPAHIAA